ncbi:hypothetical protein G9H65_02310 [Cytophagaceae bacterium 50A-KIRBA]|uniref:hypothetical protein n=1 Tax=Aquirufa ecclesiirivi TaxID=2715124 RepID=UPI00140B0A60|nr:hypothetical protein [Aquirufa ecclesiirivi]NHC48156.1 hypothetical protein [Aquirufa ecclesiirivi]
MFENPYKANFRMYLALLLILFLPEGLVVNLGTTSTSTGFFIACICSIILIYPGKGSKISLSKNFVKFYLGLFCISFLNFVVAIFINSNFNFTRFFLSVLLVNVEVFTAFLFAVRFLQMTPKVLNNFLKNIGLCLLLLAPLVLIIWKFRPPLGKEMLFFTEPSHYSVVASPFFIYYIISSHKFKSILFAVSLLICASLIENFTLILPIAIAIFILDRKIFTALVVFAIILLPIFGPSFIEYISQRYLGVLEGGDGSNISSLVYLQGWDYVFASIKSFNGLGIGFQQLGEIRIESASQDILEYMGYPLNQNDGSFLFSKFFVEVGWIALILVIIILKQILISAKRISKYRKGRDIIRIFISTTYLSFLIPLFIRNSSYFNAAVFIFIVAFFASGFLKTKFSLTKI